VFQSWDAVTWQLLRTLTVRYNYGDGEDDPDSVAPSRLDSPIDEGHLVRASFVAPDGTGALLFNREGKRRLIHWCALSGSQFEVRFESNDELDLCAARPGTVFLFSPNGRPWTLEGEPFGLVYIIPARGGRVTSLAVTPDGQRVIYACEDGVVRVWHLGGEEECAVEFRGFDVQAVTADGRFIVLTSDVGQMKLCDVLAPRTLDVAAHDGRILCVESFGNSGIVTVGVDRLVKVWDVMTGYALAALRIDVRLTHVAAITGELSLLAGDAAGGIFCWRYIDPGAPA
jgi:WD40 repeat protein